MEMHWFTAVKGKKIQLDAGNGPPFRFAYIKYIDKQLDVGNYRVILSEI